MKRTFMFFAIMLVTLTIAYSQDDNYYNGNEQAYDPNYDYNNQQYADNSTTGYQNFYNDLSAYGDWINYQGYGYVWMPQQVPGDFSPYLTAGHWIYSDYGWTWVSDYSWGWAPFHYGRWFYDYSYGWLWMPGYQWAPAWVTWGTYQNNYCWEPLAPYEMVSSYYRPRTHYWNFVPCAQITQVNICNYTVNRSVMVNNNYTVVNNNITIINQSGRYGSANYFAGPKVQEVERFSGHGVTRMNITSVNKPVLTQVNGSAVKMYRPEITRANIQKVNVPVKQNFQAPNRVNMSSNSNIQRNGMLQNNHPQQIMNSAPVRNNPAMPEQRNMQNNFAQQRNAPQFSQQPARQNFQPTERPTQPSFTQQERQNAFQPQRDNNFQAQPMQRNFAESRPQAAQPTFQQQVRPTQPSFAPQERQMPERQSFQQQRTNSFQAQPMQRNFAQERPQAAQQNFQASRPMASAQMFRGRR